MKGSIAVVSTGPGNTGNLTSRARRVLEESDVVAGYRPYLEQIAEIIAGKETISTGMRDEVGRCRAALQRAREGAAVSLVSGGDAGVYGLAGLMLELMEPGEQEAMTVIPGVTSATACASLLGAPLIHDFAVISLSDLLTDSDLIEKRLRLAAEGDFVVVLYNPQSSKRRRLFGRAAAILLEHRDSETPVGLVRNAYRDEQRVRIIPLREMAAQSWVDMRTTAVIGNSQTFVSGNRMITPRGYSFDEEGR